MNKRNRCAPVHEGARGGKVYIFVIKDTLQYFFKHYISSKSAGYVFSMLSHYIEFPLSMRQRLDHHLSMKGATITPRECHVQLTMTKYRLCKIYINCIQRLTLTILLIVIT